MPQPIREVAPGLMHWMSRHPRIGIDVSSYLVVDTGVLIDALVPPDGLDWFDEHGVPPRAVLLTNRHHLRDARTYAGRFGCTIHASRPGMHEFGGAGDVIPFEFGDELPGGVRAHEVGAICPDETALELPGVRALAVGDGVVNHGGLQFVPDDLIGDDPPAVKAGLLAAYGRLADEIDFDHLLCAHGRPVIGEGRTALRDFVALTSPS